MSDQRSPYSYSTVCYAAKIALHYSILLIVFIFPQYLIFAKRLYSDPIICTHGMDYFPTAYIHCYMAIVITDYQVACFYILQRHCFFPFSPANIRCYTYSHRLFYRLALSIHSSPLPYTLFRPRHIFRRSCLRHNQRLFFILAFLSGVRLTPFSTLTYLPL